jgi:hypothetical protein
MRSQLVVLGIVAALASCTITAVTFSTGDTPLSEDCSTPGDEDGNSLADCADPACADTPACKSSLTCGNGKLETGEQCDNGGIDTQACNGNNNGTGGPGICLTPTCGDGYTNKATGEQCDALGGIDSSACNGTNAGAVSCHSSTCGDGYLNAAAGEKCDTSGGTDTATCNGKTAGAVSCHPTVCGDGYANNAAGEQCDFGGSDTAICNGINAGPASCHQSVCGDGYVNSSAGEQCDSGGNDTATCNGINAGSASCRAPSCGDGYVNPNFIPAGALRPEECDVGFPCFGPASCTSKCNCN